MISLTIFMPTLSLCAVFETMWKMSLCLLKPIQVNTFHVQANMCFVMVGYGKTVSHVIIGLKTAKGTKQLKLDPSIYESLQKEKVEVGDVIYIEANSGAVKVRPPSCAVCALGRIPLAFLNQYSLDQSSFATSELPNF